jgi:hypothetical protein
VNRTETAIRNYLRTVLRFPDDEIDEILEIGRTSLARGMADLDRAVAAGDVRRAMEAGHALKGMLRNMGLDDTAELVGRLCALARNGPPGGLPDAADALRRDLEDFLGRPERLAPHRSPPMDSRPVKA